ncbi:unnamed protein product [Discula destructiva]
MSSASEGRSVAAEPQIAAHSADSTNAEEKPALPPLSAHEFKQYNRLADHMNVFHEHFRQTWTMLYNAASSGRRPAGMSIRQFIEQGLSFLSHLETHHSIEETYIFPVLARKMPEFQAGGKGGKKAAELLQQHREIHRGMDLMETYLNQSKKGETDFDMRVLREKMDTWAAVLWKHLDQEVETLGADNVRKYFTLEEVRKIPM